MNAARLIQAAADRLRTGAPPEVLAAATTALSGAGEILAWLDRAAAHTAATPPCCRAGAARCSYAGPALTAARRILDADLAARQETA